MRPYIDDAPWLKKYGLGENARIADIIEECGRTMPSDTPMPRTLDDWSFRYCKPTETTSECEERVGLCAIDVRKFLAGEIFKEQEKRVFKAQMCLEMDKMLLA